MNEKGSRERRKIASRLVELEARIIGSPLVSAFVEGMLFLIGCARGWAAVQVPWSVVDHGVG